MSWEMLSNVDSFQLLFGTFLFFVSLLAIREGNQGTESGLAPGEMTHIFQGVDLRGIPDGIYQVKINWIADQLMCSRRKAAVIYETYTGVLRQYRLEHPEEFEEPVEEVVVDKQPSDKIVEPEKKVSLDEA